MIAKGCKKPIRLLKLEALKRRLPTDHPKLPKVEQDLNRVKAGFRGEKSFQYYLNFLPDKEYVIFHDLRLPSPQGNSFFQMDTLLLSNKLLLINELKNMSGTLVFDKDLSQVVRTEVTQEVVFPDPIEQVSRQQWQLKGWLEQNKIVEIPIEYFVVFSGTTPLIKIAPEHKKYYRKVIHDYQFTGRMNELNERYSKEVVQEKEIRKLTKLFIKSHAELDYDILQYYQIEPSSIISGVQCPNCMKFIMERKHGTWQCPYCKTKESNGHERAIIDYLLIMDTSITRQKCAQFLHLTSFRTAAYLLQIMNLPYIGEFKTRKYLYPTAKYDKVEIL